MASFIQRNDEIQECLDSFNKQRNQHYDLIVIGNTNSGKSTFLNNLTGMKGFFNTSVSRETSCFWRFFTQSDLTTNYQLLVTVKDTYTEKIVSQSKQCFDLEADIIKAIKGMKNVENDDDLEGDSEEEEEDITDENGLPPTLKEV